MMDSTFDRFFHSVYGTRWESLRNSLLLPATKVGVHFGPKQSDEALVSLEISNGETTPPEVYEVYVLDAKKNSELPQNVEDEDFSDANSQIGQDKIYWMDAASIFPVLALNPESGSHADFCAAPGGKGLLAFRLKGESFEGRFFDLSKDRLSRLKAVFYDLLGEDITRRQSIQSMDAVKLGRLYPDQFQTVLLDAPCSGERHLLKSPTRIQEWKESYSKGLGKRQYGLLCSALDSTAPGGRLVYSTCSLSPYENDEVILRLLKRRKGEVQLIPPEQIALKYNGKSIGEKTETGHLILPDKSSFGPIFFSLLTKATS